MMLIPLFQNLKPKLLLLFLSLASCGYHTAALDDKTTISIPYVEGDQQGQLTAELIRTLDQSGMYDFVRQDGDLILKVALAGDRNDIIGFKYDRTVKKGEKENNLMASENRRALTAQVTLTDAATDKVVIGPLMITASADYDYIDINSLKELSFINDHGNREKVIRFSLGQLDSIEGAQDTALTPLYRQLAQKIAAALLRGATISAD